MSALWLCLVMVPAVTLSTRPLVTCYHTWRPASPWPHLPPWPYYTWDGTDNADNPHHHIDLFIEKVLVFYKPIASDEVLDGSGIEARGTV